MGTFCLYGTEYSGMGEIQAHETALHLLIQGSVDRESRGNHGSSVVKCRSVLGETRVQSPPVVLHFSCLSHPQGFGSVRQPEPQTTWPLQGSNVEIRTRSLSVLTPHKEIVCITTNDLHCGRALTTVGNVHPELNARTNGWNARCNPEDEDDDVWIPKPARVHS